MSIGLILAWSACLHRWAVTAGGFRAGVSTMTELGADNCLPGNTSISTEAPYNVAFKYMTIILGIKRSIFKQKIFVEFV